MYKVIIIDDEETTRCGLEKHIKWQEHGFEVVASAQNGEEAIVKIAEHKPYLALCDIKMAHMDGIELGHIINKEYPYCKIIYLSGYTNQFNLRDALRLRALDFFDKPLDIAAFHDRLKIIKAEFDQKYLQTEVSSDKNSTALLIQELLFELLKNNNPNREKVHNISKILNIDLIDNKETFVIMHNNDANLDYKITTHIQSLSENTSLILNSQFDGITYKLVQNDHIDHEKIVIDLDKKDKVLIGTIHTNIYNIRNEIPYMLRVFQTHLTSHSGQILHLAKISEANVILEVNQILNDFYHEDLSIKEISEYVYLSPQYLCNLYKKESGKTINDQLTDIRLEEARKLLEENAYKIYEIAQMVGYSDSSYFSRVFKKKYKISPKEYRDRL